MDYVTKWPQVVVAVVIYFISLVFYRLAFHPLSKFPGPKLTAVTRFYEAYFDVVQNGQYTFKIAEMHKKYGPIIRISPYELHVSDPKFFNSLYRQDAHFDKNAWAVDAFAAKGATLFTADHKVHQARRRPLNPFFSKTKVANRQSLINRHMDKLYRRICEFAATGTTFDFGAATTALTRDVVSEFILDKSYNILDQGDFDASKLASSRTSGQIWRVTKFVRWVAPTIQAIPLTFMMMIASEEVKAFLHHLQETQQHTRSLMAAATSPDAGSSKRPRTIVDEIMTSELPLSDKVFERVIQDVNTVTGAGFETTASVLRLVFFNVFGNAEILQRLRTELTSAGVTPDQLIDLKTLEKLPYLTAILTEGLRLSPAIATRMARVSNTDMFYDQWRIPAGTAVGMTLVLMHTDERFYPEPHKFNPGRWLDNGVLKKADQAFAPFSKGTRNCIGMNLAWAEMYIFVARFVQSFDFRFDSASAEDFECVSDQFAIGTRGKGNLLATVSRHLA